MRDDRRQRSPTRHLTEAALIAPPSMLSTWSSKADRDPRPLQLAFTPQQQGHSVSNDINDVIRAANSSLGNEQGFRGCSLSATYSVLSYRFETPEDAELFKQRRELLAEFSGMRYEIRNELPNVVFETRRHN